MNSGGERADTPQVRYSSPDSSYFVKLGADQHVPAPDGRAGLGSVGTPKHRHRRREGRGRRVLIVLVVLGLGSWTYWAAHRPGGVSATVSGWVSKVRGDVANVSTDPDLATARRFFTGQYAATGQYPKLGEADLTAAGVGVGVTVEWCGPQAVVIQGGSGGGTVSRLLLAGHDLGTLNNRYDCPADLNNPLPWKK